MKKCLLIIGMLSVLISFCGVSLADTNVALRSNGGIATSSTVGCWEGCRYPYYANDGDKDTIWAGTEYSGDWLQIEFDKVYSINKIVIYSGCHQVTLDVQLSEDGYNWKTVIESTTTSEPDTIIRDITPTDGKFIKLNITNSDAPASHVWKSCINELEAWTGYADTAILTISPPSGAYLTTQGFDIGLILEAPGLSIAGGNATLNGSDVTSALANCIIPGTLISGGKTFRCPWLSGGTFGTGTHTFDVTLDLSNGSSVNDSVTWEVKENTEP